MDDKSPETSEQILAAAPLIAPTITPERLTEIAPDVLAVLHSLERLDELDLTDYEPCLTLALRPVE